MRQRPAWEDRLRLFTPGAFRVVVRCGYCAWQVEADVDEAHAAFEAHVCVRPKPAKRRRAA